MKLLDSTVNLTIGQQIALSTFLDAAPNLNFRGILYAVMHGAPEVEVDERYQQLESVELAATIEQLATIIDRRCVEREAAVQPF